MSLNIWGGRVYKPFLNFVKEYNNQIDIFCFQEFFSSPIAKFNKNGTKSDIYTEISDILSDYYAFFAPSLTGYDTDHKVDFDLFYGQATFVKKSIDLVSQETVFVHGRYDYTPEIYIKGIKNGVDFPRNIHLVKLKINGKEVLIGNLHGFWIPGAKTDTPQSISQVKKIKEIFDKFEGAKILCGDFNLRPDTKSIKMLEENLKNLIIEYGVTNTRSKHHTREEKFADYILVSKDIKINNFAVIAQDVSDHLPLILDFEV